MKILWVKSDFLHPTTRGGQIRSLEILRRLHLRHEIHYVAYNDSSQPEGLARAVEYCSFAYPLQRLIPNRRSPMFALQLIGNLLSPLPLAVSRYASPLMKRKVAELTSRQQFDSVVCDFLFPAPNVPRLEECVLFQHNVESMIWRRHVEHASHFLKRAYFRLQARRMHDYEREVCNRAAAVIAVSEMDRDLMGSMFGASRVFPIATGVDVESFAPPGNAVEPVADLIFIGSMDWMPNIDGARFFVESILPLIWRERPETTLALVGRLPPPEMVEWSRRDSRIVVTGTVPDVRPYLWGSAVSIVPLRIGGGTRLKIYEAMAAELPVVSTTIGAEGLVIHPQEDIRVADSPAAIASECLALLNNTNLRKSVARAGRRLVTESFSWEHVAVQFENILENVRAGKNP